MHNLNVSAMDTRDSQGRARFSLFYPEKQINLKMDKSQLDFLKSEYYPYQPVNLSGLIYKNIMLYNAFTIGS